jgi:hypothetical protein
MTRIPAPDLTALVPVGVGVKALEQQAGRELAHLPGVIVDHRDRRLPPARELGVFWSGWNWRLHGYVLADVVRRWPI